jgi:hypothetical protein
VQQRPRATIRLRARSDSWRAVARLVFDAVWASYARTQCTICGAVERFLYFGNPPRESALCPCCRSLERHRLFALWWRRPDANIHARRILHFAPELPVEQHLRSCAATYLSADIRPGRADVVADITSLQFPDQSFDVVVCLHVLEHVDDITALAEIYRVLENGGRALIMVPVVEGWDQTYESIDVTTARERRRHYGQADHLRYYGRDFRNRVRSAGFDLTEFSASPGDEVMYGILRADRLFVARRP